MNTPPDLYSDLEPWAAGHEELLAWTMGASIVVLVGSALLAPLLLARIDENHFTREGPDEDAFRTRHPAIRIIARVIKNGVGLLLLVTGFVLLFLPGQGILTILAGLFLVDFPGKRRLQLALVRRPGVLKALNWMRRKGGAEPLRVPSADGGFVGE